MKPPVAVVFVISFSLLAISKAQAECTLATLTGPYGFHAHGFNLGGEERFAAVGFVTFDGKGGADIKIVTSRDGVIRRPAPFTARYDVNKDCTATIDGRGTGGNLQDMVIVDGGNEIRSLVREPSQAVWHALYKKRTVEGCTADIMDGSWGYSLQGAILQGESFREAAIMGWVTFNAKTGRLTGTELRNVGGELVTLNVDTTYTVNLDCTVETAGLSYSALLGNGSETFLMRTIDGWVVSGFPKKQ